MTTVPSVGEEVLMAFMGDDVHIEVYGIPDSQPLVETDGCHIVLDQYGEEHIVQLDGDSWVTVNIDELSPEGSNRWFDRAAAGSEAGPKP